MFLAQQEQLPRLLSAVAGANGVEATRRPPICSNSWLTFFAAEPTLAGQKHAGAERGCVEGLPPSSRGELSYHAVVVRMLVRKPMKCVHKGWVHV